MPTGYDNVVEIEDYDYNAEDEIHLNATKTLRI